ncbi:MAG TPA: hypothetical protein VNX25_03470 [Verrucomicrobiae bacterium]|nr:hypothetical protein [Verrucomicrobiae bacterium]
MKRAVSSVLFLLLSTMLFSCALGTVRREHVGYYMKHDNPQEFTELREDGTFSVFERGQPMTGTWSVTEEGKLFLNVDMNRRPARPVSSAKVDPGVSLEGATNKKASVKVRPEAEGRLYFPIFGLATGKITDGRIVDNDGQLWIRSAPSQSTPQVPHQ